MEENIKNELTLLAHKILGTSLDDVDFSTLKQEAKSIYEHIVIAEYLQKKSTETLPNPIAATTLTTESHINPVMGFTQVAKTTPVSPTFEKKKEPTLEEILSQVPKDPVFEEKNQLKENVVKTLNDVVNSQNIQFGLNDRLAFIKHLFDGNEADFSEGIKALNKIQSGTEAMRFIQERIKPVFNNWEGKEEYEERFVSIIMRKFN